MALARHPKDSLLARRPRYVPRIALAHRVAHSVAVRDTVLVWDIWVVLDSDR